MSGIFHDDAVESGLRRARSRAKSKECVRCSVSLSEYQGQWAGPELTRQSFSGLWPIHNQRLRHFDRCDVDDERAGVRSAFDRIDAGYRFGIQGIGAEPVHSFSRESDEAAGAEKLGGALNFAGSNGGRHNRL